MKEQHDLDRLLKNKFDAREFDFQEAYWEEAAGMIDAAEAAGKNPLGFLWRWFAADSMLVVLLMAAIFLFPTLSTHSSDSSLPEIETLSQNRSSASSISPLSQTKTQTQTQTQTNSTTPIKNQKSPLPIIPSANSAKKPISYISNSSTETSIPKISEYIISATNEESTPTFLRKKIYSLNHLLYILHANEKSPDERLLPASPQVAKIKKHHFCVIAGWQSSTSFRTAEEKKISHWPTFGLKYAYAINSRFSLKSGLLLENRSALHLTKSFTSTQFGFGRNEETVSLQPQSAHYLAVPLQLGFRFHKRHSVALGINAAYLLNVRAALETQRTNAFGTISETTETAWGYRQGFQRVDGGLLLGYQYQFRPRMGLMLEAYQGFLDITDNAFWEVERADMQRQMRVKVYCNLF